MNIYTFQFLLKSDNTMTIWFLLMFGLGLLISGISIYKNKPALWRVITKIIPLSSPFYLLLPLSPILIDSHIDIFGDMVYILTWILIGSSIYALYKVPFSEGVKTKARAIYKEEKRRKVIMDSIR